MTDFNLHPHPKGTLIQAVSSEAMDLIVERFRMMADPVVDPVGVIIFKRMASDAGLDITDLTAPAAEPKLKLQQWLDDGNGRSVWQ